MRKGPRNARSRTIGVLLMALLGAAGAFAQAQVPLAAAPSRSSSTRCRTST